MAECPVCFSATSKMCTLAPCSHALCLGCAKKLRRCPLCRCGIVDRVQRLQPKRLDELCCEAMGRRMEMASPEVVARCSEAIKCRLLGQISNRRLVYGDLFRALAVGNASLRDWNLNYAVNLRASDLAAAAGDLRRRAVSLNLTSCECLDDRAFSALFGEEPLPCLEHLTIDSLDEVRGEALAEHGAAHLPRLRTFSARGCKRLRQGAFAAVMRCPDLKALDATQCSAFSFHEALALLPSVAPGTRGKPLDAPRPRRQFPPRQSLVRLCASACTRLTTASVVECLERGAPALRHLDLSHTNVDADAVLEALATHAPCLEELNLSRTAEETCTDRGIAALCGARCAVHLRALNVDGADDITDRSLEALRRACKALRSLYVSECRGLSEAGITTMARDLPRLSSMSLRNTAISRSGQYRLVGLLHSRPGPADEG